MKIHEYQAKELFRKFNVPTTKGKVAFNPYQAVANARELGGKVWVVKAQIHAGGRGKAGGVKVAKSIPEVLSFAQGMYEKTLITHQTGPSGKVVQRLLVEEGVDIGKEYYVGMVVDRATQRPVVMASSEGGVEIEEVAARTPEKILKEVVDPVTGLQPFQARKLAFGIGIPPECINDAVKFFTNLYKMFVELDCSLAEVNPLILTKDKKIMALDGKITFDDNSMFRHPDIKDLRDYSEETQGEIQASLFDLNYISLDGNIACLVNGAGLAMATMDIIKLYGGNPANFLDVGGGATKESVIAAFKIILTDPHVKGILVNIFGGIVRCDIIAEAVMAAAKEIGIKIPLVVRLEGTNVEQAKKLLAASDLKITPASSMQDAAQKIVAATK